MLLAQINILEYMYIINNASKKIRFMNTHVAEKFDRCVHVDAAVPDGINISVYMQPQFDYRFIFALSSLSFQSRSQTDQARVLI